MTDKTPAVVFILQVKVAYLGGLLHRDHFSVAVLSVAEDEGAAPVGVLPTAAALHFAARAGRAVPQEGNLHTAGHMSTPKCMTMAAFVL